MCTRWYVLHEFEDQEEEETKKGKKREKKEGFLKTKVHISMYICIYIKWAYLMWPCKLLRFLILSLFFHFLGPTALCTYKSKASVFLEDETCQEERRLFFLLHVLTDWLLLCICFMQLFFSFISRRATRLCGGWTGRIKTVLYKQISE